MKLVSVLKSKFNIVNKIEFATITQGAKEGYILACHSWSDPSGRESVVQTWFLDEECKERKDVQGWEAEGKFASFAPNAFSHDGRVLLSLGQVHDQWGLHPTVTATDVLTGEKKFHMQGHTDSITWAGFSPDDTLIATTAWDGYCKLYEAESGKHIRDLGPTGGQNWACDFSVDSNNIAVSRGNGNLGPSTFVWRTDDPRSFPVTLQGGGGWSRRMSWSPDGKKLGIGAADGRLVVLDAWSMKLEQVWQVAKRPQRFIDEVTEVKWLEDGKRILFKPSDGSTHMYDFDENIKWKWGPGEKDDWAPGAWSHTLVVMEKRGIFGTVDQDGSFRIWKIPDS